MLEERDLKKMVRIGQADRIFNEIAMLIFCLFALALFSELALQSPIVTQSSFGKSMQEKQDRLKAEHDREVVAAKQKALAKEQSELKTRIEMLKGVASETGLSVDQVMAIEESKHGND